MKSSGRVIWITGLSEAGKTTLARALLPHLPGQTVLMDGDDLRRALELYRIGYDGESRRTLGLTYSRLARMLADQGATVVVAAIALFHEIHDWNRANLPRYFEVFLDVPADVLRSRDSKGLYAAERQGAVRNVAGSDTLVEFPERPDLRIRNDGSVSVAECVDLVLTGLGLSRTS